MPGGMRPGKGVENLFPFLSPFLSFFLSFSARTVRRRYRKPADKGGYGLRIPSAPIAVAFLGALPLWIITANKGKKRRNVLDSGNVTLASPA